MHGDGVFFTVCRVRLYYSYIAAVSKPRNVKRELVEEGQIRVCCPFLQLCDKNAVDIVGDNMVVRKYNAKGLYCILPFFIIVHYIVKCQSPAGVYTAAALLQECL